MAQLHNCPTAFCTTTRWHECSICKAAITQIIFDNIDDAGAIQCGSCREDAPVVVIPAGRPPFGPGFRIPLGPEGMTDQRKRNQAESQS